MEMNESNSVDEFEKDNREVGKTDTVLENKFGGQTPAQLRMAKAREARQAKIADRKANPTQNSVNSKEVRDLYSAAILAFIQVRNPRSSAEFDVVKALAADVVTHVLETYP